MKADFLFVGLNLNTVVQEKMEETCTFHRWCFKSKENWKYLNVETRLLLAIPKKSGYAPGCTASIYQKILWFAFHLIYVVLWFSVTVGYILFRNRPNLNW